MGLGGMVWGLFGGLSSGSDQDAKAAANEKESGGGDDEPASWVCILITHDAIEARIAAARLDDEGIAARLHQESASSAFPVTVGMLGAIRVFVPEPQEERAIIVLKETMDIPFEDEEEDD